MLIFQGVPSPRFNSHGTLRKSCNLQVRNLQGSRVMKHVWEGVEGSVSEKGGRSWCLDRVHKPTRNKNKRNNLCVSSQVNQFYKFWVVATQILLMFNPKIREWSNLTNIFQICWNYQVVFLEGVIVIPMKWLPWIILRGFRMPHRFLVPKCAKLSPFSNLRKELQVT